jgi:TPR repeat protein
MSEDQLSQLSEQLYQAGQALISDEGTAGQDIALGVARLKESAESGNSLAAVKYGVHMEEGQICDRNPEEAVRAPSSQYHYGGCLEDRSTIESQIEEAAMYYKLAADRGDADEPYLYGRCLAHGMGIEQNGEEAAKCYADCLQCGIGVEQNVEEAEKYFKRAADQGDSEAQLWSGICSALRTGIERNPEAAMQYCKLSPVQGSAVEQVPHGWHLQRGIGTERNPEETVHANVCVIGRRVPGNKA